MAAKGVELASAYISLSVSTDEIPEQIKKAFGEAAKPAGKSGQAAGKEFGNGFRDTSVQAAGKAGDAIGKALKGALVVGVGGAVATVGTILTKGFSRLKKIDDAQFKLKALGHTTAGVAEIMKSAEASVKGTAFALDEAASAAASAVAAGVKPGKELTGYLTTISDTAAIAGTSFDEMASIFNKVRANGKAYTDDLQMLQDRGVPVMQYLQKQYGVTADEFTKMVQDGKVSSADFARALDQNLGGAAQKMGESLSGAISNLDAAAGRLGASLINAVSGGDMAGTTAESVGKITEKLDEMNAWVKDNGDRISGWFADTGKAATYFGEAVVATVAGTTRGLAVLVNAVGDTLGAMTRGVAAFNRLIGRGEIADELDAQADSYFGMADGIYAASDQALNLAQNIGGLRDGIDNWKNETQAAAQFTEQLGSAVEKIAPQNWWGKTIIEAPTAEEIEKIKQAGFEVKEIPGTKDIELIPKTQKATEELNAWRKKQTGDPATIPVEADTAPADSAMQTFIEKWSKPLVVGVDILPGQTPAYQPGTIAPDDLGGLLGAPPQGGAGPGPGLSIGSAGNGVPPGQRGTGTYGLPASTNTGGYGTGNGSTFPPWVMEIANKFGIKPSTYSGHQADNRNEAGYAPNPQGLNRGIDWSGPVANMQKFADYLATVPGAVEQVIWQNPNTGSATEIAGGRPQPGYFSGDLGGHQDHVHTRQSTPIPLPRGTYDQGGWLPPGQTLANNQTGKPELILTPEQVKEMAAQGVDPNALLHGSGGGQAPGPVAHTGSGAAPGPQRTEGYIPAAAGNIEPVGEGGLSNFLDLGESFVQNLIDTGAQAASMAATAAAGAASGGAGAAAGPAASTAIQMGAEAAKRGVSYLYDLGGIWGEALMEQAFPFGAPRWLGSANPMAFMPQGMPGGEKKAPGTMGAARDHTMSAAAAVNAGGPPVAPGDPAAAGPAVQRGAQAIAAASGTPPPPPAAAAQQQDQTQTPPAGTVPNPLDPSTWLQFGGVFDQGGILQPNSVGINLSKRPEAIFTQKQLKEMQRTSAAAGSGSGDVHFHSRDDDEMFRRYQWEQRRKARQYSGRP